MENRVSKLRIVKRSGGPDEARLQERVTRNSLLIRRAIELAATRKAPTSKQGAQGFLSYHLQFLDDRDEVVLEKRLLGARTLLTDEGKFALEDGSLASLLDAVLTPGRP